MKYFKGFVHDLYTKNIKFYYKCQSISYKAGVLCKCRAMNKNSWWGGNHSSLPPLAVSLLHQSQKLFLKTMVAVTLLENLLGYYYLLSKHGYIFGGVYLFVRWSATASNIT